MRVGHSTDAEPGFPHFWPWMVWAIAALGVPYQFVLQSSTTIMIPMLMRALSIDETGIGFLTSSFFYSYLLLQVPAGMLVDRFGARRVIFWSILFCALACLLFSTAQNLLMAQLSRVMMGMVTAPCVPAAMSVAAHWFPPKRFVILAGLAESLGMLGGALGEASLGEVVLHYGWRDTLLGCALVGIVLAFLMFLFVQDRPPKAYGVPKNTDDAAQTEQRGIFSGFGMVISNAQVWLIVGFAAFTFAMLPALAGLWAVPALQAIYKLKLETAALGSAMIFFGTALGLPFWGWCSEAMQKRKPVLFIGTILNIILTGMFILCRICH